MDDFLHNLRSGKLKQPDRSNRPYNDPQYKGGQRRNMMDRRKREFDSKESYERLNAIKEVLETLVESQKRMAEAYEARTAAEERKASAMEILAKNLYRALNPNAGDADKLFAPESPAERHHLDIPQQSAESVLQKDPAVSGNVDIEDTSSIPSDPQWVAPQESEEAKSENTQSPPASRRLSYIDRQKIFSIIVQRRESGDNWEQVARHIADQGFPTISGKGSWRGVMAKNLFEKMSS